MVLENPLNGERDALVITFILRHKKGGRDNEEKKSS